MSSPTSPSSWPIVMSSKDAVAGLEMPGTRVDVAPHAGAATQLMGAEEVEAATKHVAAKKAA